MLESLSPVLERQIQLVAPHPAAVDALRIDIGRIESIHGQLEERLRREVRPGTELRIINFSELERDHGTKVAEELCQPLIDKIAAQDCSCAWTGVIKLVPIKHFNDHYLVAVSSERRSA